MPSNGIAPSPLKPDNSQECYSSAIKYPKGPALRQVSTLRGAMKGIKGRYCTAIGASFKACADSQNETARRIARSGQGASNTGTRDPGAEAGLMGKVQRRDAGLAGGIPTQDMRPHMRLAHQSYAERGIAGRVGMRRSAAIRATCNGGQYRPRS